MSGLNPTEFTIYPQHAVCNLCRTKPMSLSHAIRHSKIPSHVSRTVTNGTFKCNIIKTPSSIEEPDHAPPLTDFQVPAFDELSARINSCVNIFDNVDTPYPADEELPLHSEHDQWEFDEQYFKVYDVQGSEKVHSLTSDNILHTTVLTSTEWAPYPSKGMYLTDILFSSPRLRFSEAQKRAILSWGKEVESEDVPSLYALEKFQKDHITEVGNPTVEKRSRTGKVFYANEVGASFAKDFANPLVRPHLTLYPEQDGTKRVSQIWHGEKWRSQLTEDMLPPMAIHPVSEKHFYRGELSQCINGSYFIPNNWFSKGDGSIWATGFASHCTEAGLMSVIRQPVERSLEDLSNTYEDLTRNREIQFDSEFIDLSSKMPHPLRVKAAKRPLYHLFAIIFIDDVSGNISKQWNKHYVCYISNANLPREELDREYNVRFASSSPHVNAMELAQGISESFKNAHSGIIAYDCERREECFLDVFPIFLAADNPMHAEMCSHAGLTGNFFCRTCHVGGTQETKRTDEGYLSIFKSGIIRTPGETRDSIFNQFMRALQPNSQTALERMVRESGVKDVIAQPILEILKRLSNELYSSSTASHVDIQKALSNKLREMKAQGSIQNPFLEMKGFDVHLDTPTEILHTILLGIVKYFWGQTVFLIINEKKFHIFQARLDSLSSNGLNIPRIMANYMCQYRGSLIGKHFKSLVQLLPMIIYDLVHPDLLHVWLLMGRLMVLCWHIEINDLDAYIEKLESVVDQFLTKSAICAPSIIISKPKFHFLMHLGLYIRRFGPALLFATERYESYNSIFRQTSIHSNRMAPSRDTAITFAQLDRVKHIVSGGWWFNKLMKSYTRASPRVLEFISQTPDFAHLVGLPSERRIKSGTVTRYPRSKGNQDMNLKRGRLLTYEDLEVLQATELRGLYPGHTAVERFKTIIAQSGDVIEICSAVIVKELSMQHVGLVQEIFSLQSDIDKEMIIVQLFEFGTERHAILDMPTLTLTSRHLPVHTEDLLCAVNIQHDCSKFQCDVSGSAKIMQERQETTLTKSVVAHKDDQHFILNTLALHNYRFLEALLPPTIRQPCPYYSGISACHDVCLRMAATLRDKKLQAKEREEEKARNATLGRTQFVDKVSQEPAASSSIHGAGNTSSTVASSSSRPVPRSKRSLVSTTLPAMQPPHNLQSGPPQPTFPQIPPPADRSSSSIQFEYHMSQYPAMPSATIRTAYNGTHQQLSNITNIPENIIPSTPNFFADPYPGYTAPSSSNGGVYYNHTGYINNSACDRLPLSTLAYPLLSHLPQFQPPGSSLPPHMQHVFGEGPGQFQQRSTPAENNVFQEPAAGSSVVQNSSSFAPPAPKKSVRRRKAVSNISLPPSVQPPIKKQRTVRSSLSKTQLAENEQTLREELFD